MEQDYKPKKAERLISRQEDDSLLIFDSDSGSIKVLNETAALVWNTIDGNTSAQEIIDVVSEKNPEESRDTIERDVKAFLEDLQSHHFIM
ncbi:MAG: PqqD family protein [Theionarchaea archaeon]|nr:PqqD family protein [Theionarchaea archaeon]MBU6999701.1 PqqD family protein [Theionarchaea archaeon]MBU7020677.1 PqqD family protein [Theionarchaea archaeon]MBU7034643.1 PqqD family protein [Theionarchaea archaeon]MBU7039851.1 PqqD family protein [Theionarchaea archaeon]